MDMQQRVQRHYQDTSRLKVRIETHRRYGQGRFNLDEECRRVLQLRGDEPIMDVGCGTGTFLLYLRGRGHEGSLTGIDQASAMIAEASTARNDSETRWLVGNAVHLPFPEKSFRRIVARHMLYHGPEIPKALNEFGRVTVPDGCLLATTHSNRSLPRIDELRSELMAAFGLPEINRPRDVERFCTENAKEILDRAYEDVEESLLTNDLLFRTSEPIVAYINSLLNVPGDQSIRVEIQRWLRDRTSQLMGQLAGCWRDPSIVGIYRCKGPIASPA